jgi:hypothetical protein
MGQQQETKSMPMIDVYATSGTFPAPNALARDLAATLMQIEGVPEFPHVPQEPLVDVSDAHSPKSTAGGWPA